MRGWALLPLLGLALAQVGLLDGPRPSSEVRGTLEGDARQGYRVRVEFLVEVGGNPLQGTTYQALTWDGRLYLCPGACDTFRLSGYSPGGTYTQAVFDLYDAQNRLRGRAGVNTVLDAQGRPQYHRVDYAVWPLTGTRTWQPSPDNPVPLERGGWLTARPPGGSPERYRYPGMEGYEPPSGGSILSGISPGDRDLAQKTLIDSLAALRQFYRRQPSGSEIWFFVPEVSPWTLSLAQEFRAQNGGRERFVVPEGTALSYCPTAYRNDSRFHVLPRPTLGKGEALAVIWPPRGATQRGAVMAGAYLVDRPAWQETDSVSFNTALVPTADGLPEARAYVWGQVSQGNLRARVEFRETALGQVGYVGYRSYGRDWNGRDTFDLGNGQEEVRLTLPSPPPTGWTRVEPALDAQGRNRGYAQVYAQATTTWSLDTTQTVGRTGAFSQYWYSSPEGRTFVADVGRGPETLWFRGCSVLSSNYPDTVYGCGVRDGQNQDRGRARVTVREVFWGEVETYSFSYTADLYPWKATVQITSWQAYWYLSRWQTTWRQASDNDRPVEPGGFVTAEGRRYRIPGLEGYLVPQGREIEAVEGDPYVTYITRSLLPDRNPYGGVVAQRPEAGTWYKPLSDWCRERGR